MAVAKAYTRNEVANTIKWSGDAQIVDLKTMITYNIRGCCSTGYDHSDYQCVTRADTVAKRKAHGLDPSTIPGTRDDWKFDARPVLLKVNGYLVLGATHCFAHSIPVAYNADNIVSPARTRDTERLSTGQWAVGSHFCFHYIDTINMRTQDTWSIKMNDAIKEAAILVKNYDPSLEVIVDASGYTSGGGSSVPVQPADPPVVIREGSFVLRMELQPANQFYNKFKVFCTADKVPFIYLPTNYKLNDKRGEDLIGYCSLIVDKKTNNAVASLIGGVRGLGQVDTVSAKAGWSLGANQPNPFKINTDDLKGDFTIAIFDDFAPEWSDKSDLLSQVESECSRRLGASLVGLNNNSRAMALSGGTGSPQSIDPSLIEKFMVTVNRSTRVLDYKKLSEMGVIGVCVEAGFLFNTGHVRQSIFSNPQIARQIEGIKAAGLDFSLYFYARAQNLVEVMEEISQFQHVLRRYAPTLGVWLRPGFGSNDVRNNLVVDEYYKQLVKLGLVDKIGFYCTRDQLKVINWEKYKDDWYWWIDDHVTDIKVVDELLTPEFFMLNGEVK